MFLRKPEHKDAPLMLEWMHDDNVVHDLHTDFASKTIDDCRRFIDAAKAAENEYHLVAANSEDEYMGTVSLKHITAQGAEFAIVMRRSAMGGGYAVFAMDEMLHIAFDELGLDYVYWCVSPVNRRAVRFYKKHGYSSCSRSEIPAKLHYDEKSADHYLWFMVRRKNIQ